MRSTVDRALAAVALTAPVFAAGCLSTPDTASAPSAPPAWETKTRSILPRPVEEPRLAMPAPLELHAGPARREAALDLLRIAVESENALIRANAIEALELAPDEAAGAITAGLTDRNRGVRFVAAMTAGRLHLSGALPRLRALLQDSSPSVQAAAMFAIDACGERIDVSPLGGMVMSDDPEVKGNAALVLGEMGEASALPMLREALRRRLPRASVSRQRVVDLQIAEAMVKLGADSELEVIRAALFAPDEQAELVVLACQLCGRLKDRAYVGSLRDIATRTQPRVEAPEVRLAAVLALAQIDHPNAISRIPIEYLGHERAEVRAQAAATLGWTGDPAALTPLAATLDDRNALVQVASAGAILRLTSAVR